MRCPACIEAGKTSRIYETIIRPGTPGAVERFWDEAGLPHVHAHALRHTQYACSNGHHYKRTFLERCPRPVCDWNDQDLVKAGQKDIGT